MRTKQLCVLISVVIKGEVDTINKFAYSGNLMKTLKLRETALKGGATA